MLKKNGFTLIELLVVVAIIGILAAVGVVAYSGYTSGAKNTVIKSNLKQVIRSINQDFISCEINGGNIDRYVRTGGKVFVKRSFQCSRTAFDQGVLQIHFLGLGLKDPVITIPKAWTHNGTVIPNDVGAVYAGVPFKNKYYPAYWVGKTYIESKGKTLYLKTYLMDETTLLSNIIEIPF